MAGDAVTTQFEALVEEHKNAVYAVAYCTTGDGQISEDVAQEAFLQAWRSRDNLREAHRFRAWVCGIARNIARNENRRRKRHPEDSLEVSDTGAEPAVLDEMLRSERLAVLWQALGKVQEPYREVLSLYYQQGKSARVVAKSLGISDGLVHQRLKRGREQLKEQINHALLEDLRALQPSKGFSARVM
ncbi:MAG: sigma-70 family RNA polymerase sigma factor, partial [Myxococcales bacterium]|nr:sigma-70 family RNA polymerase sigma factor [Myxococcales bacterium]